MKRYVKNMRNIALTIDVEQDVPPTLNTWRGVEEGLPILLDLLSEHNVRATFFVTGKAAEKYPKLIRKISCEHEVGCHGYDHERYDKLNPDEQSRKIELATRILTKITGQKPAGFRVPNFKPTIHAFAAIEHARYVYDASVAIYKTDPGSSRFRFVEIQNTLPSSILRLPVSISTRVLRLCMATFPRVVMDYHPWEVIEMRGVRFDCRFATGEIALRRLEQVLKYWLDKEADFRLMNEIAKSSQNKNKKFKSPLSRL